MKKKAVFLDRDGTINRDVGYPNSSESIHIYPFSFEAVRLFNQAGFLTVVVTNQSGIARGLIGEDQLNRLHVRMKKDFEREKASIDVIYYCPHFCASLDPRYKKDCLCRKPSPALGQKAADDFNIDLPGSYVIGDKSSDILFGLNIGAIPILVRTGYGRKTEETLSHGKNGPAFVADSILEAALWILDREKRHSARNVSNG